MAKQYKTKITYGSAKRSSGSKKSNSRVTVKSSHKKDGAVVSRMEMAAKNSPRAKALSSRSKSGKLKKRFKMSKKTWANLRKVGLILVGIIFITGLIGGFVVFAKIQELDSELPSADEPFGAKETASVIYDRNGKELYRVYDEYNRDPVNIDEIPYEVRWSFLAAEDVDFYTHNGFDAVAIARCAVLNVSSGSTLCGGSTITQQMVKITTLTNEQSIERKLKELLMSMKVEQAYSKDEILELYLTVAPFGNNIYGITSAADVYYRKEPKDLTLAEAAVLAGIIQSPAYNSPTLSLDPEEGLKRSEIRKNYILDQLYEKRDKINEQHRLNVNDPEAPDLITEEIIEEARNEELTYAKPRFGYKAVAGHFIDYVNQILTERNYKTAEEPFTTAELQTGGYRIHTTLDLDIQKIAEKTVKEGVNNQGAAYGGANAAMVTLVPSTGEVLAMVGSKNYNGGDEGCNSKGEECAFNGQVNIITSRQSPGSSTKPHGFYEAYRQGLIYTGSFLPDIPITVDGYELKNWNGRYTGINLNSYAAEMLRQSLNMPALIVVDMIGVEGFLNVMRDFGYTTYGNSDAFGASVILGGADVIPIEHAQGFGVFANGGYLVEHEVILKIEDAEGNVIYEHKPQEEKVADPKAVYMLNQSLNNNYDLSTEAWDGNDIANKTGTSENNRDTWFAAYSPDIVALGWLGNNNNVPMSNNAFGSTSVKPWMSTFLQRVKGSSYFSNKTSFESTRPAGVIQGGGCPSTGRCTGAIAGIASGYMLADVDYAADSIRERVTVCKDQEDKLARQVDIDLGLSKKITAVRWILPKANLQADLDQYFKDRGQTNEIPSEYCTKDRGLQEGPWFPNAGTGRPKASSVAGNTAVQIVGSVFSEGGTITDLKAYIDYGDQANTGILLGNIAVGADGSFDVTFNYPTMEPGSYRIGLVASDDTAAASTGVKLQYVTVTSATTTNLKLNALPNLSSHNWGDTIGDGKNITLSLNYTGYGGNGNIGSAEVFVRKNGGNFVSIGSLGSAPGFSTTWGADIDNETATYEFYIKATTPNGGNMESIRPLATQVVVNKQ